MSVQTGIYYFNKKEVQSHEVLFMIMGLEDRGPDYANFRISGSIGMGFRGCLIAPEDCEEQPLQDGAGRLLTFDGRLDNRAEIATSAGIQAEHQLSDAQLVLAAFEKTGKNCFETLTGEFACVLWDDRHQVLYLLRSQCGSRPLFYNVDKCRILWSSEFDDLVLKSDVNPTVNDEYAIGYLYYQPDIDASPFLQFPVVPSGTYIEINDGGVVGTPIPTWNPNRIKNLTLKSDAEYEEAWQEAVRKSIHSRLRTRHPIFCELSGGLDSSTVLLVADQLLRQQGRDPSTLTSVSCTYQTSRSCDESYFISMVEEKRGRTGIHVSEAEQTPTMGLDNISFTGVPNAHHCFPGRFQTIANLMRLQNARVLLTGIGGDELFWSIQTGSPELADLLSEWHLIEAISKGQIWSQFGGMPLWQVLLSSGVEPLYKGSPPAWLRAPDVKTLLRWMTTSAQQIFFASGRTRGLRVQRNVSPASRRLRVLSIRSVSALIAAGYFQEYRSICFSHPFASRELADFVLSLPMNQIARPAEERSLMRRATKGLLPEKVRIRKSKGTIDESICRLFEAEWARIGETKSLQICQRGYAKSEAVSESIRRVALGRRENSGQVLRFVSLERWLRSISKIPSQRSIIRSRPAGSVTVKRETLTTRMNGAF